MALNRSLVSIGLASFLVLYFELVAIRWLSSELEVFSYFKNFPLLGAFLGLGLGSLSPSSADRLSGRFAWLLAMLAAILGASAYLQVNAILLPPSGIEIWADPRVAARYVNVLSPAAQALGLPGWTVGWATEMVFLLVVLVVILPVTALFSSLGALLGRFMNSTQPLMAYSANLLGSLAGIACFTLLSFLQTPPFIWIAVGLGAAAGFLPRVPRTAIPVGLALVGAALASLHANVAWSPYYRVSHTPMAGIEPGGHSVAVNHRYHQFAIDLSDEALKRRPDLAELRGQYELPFEVAKWLDVVAVAGAGTGNDVAAATRLGARRIVAVEIDPVILDLGYRLHAEHPYAPNNVEVLNTDARAWLRQGQTRYDVISFGLLDSHTLLSAMSSIRLESYLYTVEGLRDAHQRLSPDGIAAISFAIVGRDWLAERLFATIDRAVGAPPVVVATPQLSVLTYLFGPGVDPPTVATVAQRYGFDVASDRYARGAGRPATDDWPFLYLHPTQAPASYLIALGILLVLSAFVIRMRLAAGTVPSALNAQMFFLGAGFLLVEVKSITELSLLFGSTWVVNSAVFAAILLMALGATLAVGRWARPNVGVVYALLLSALLLGFIFPVSALNALGQLERAAIGSALAALPVAFSGIVFATAFRMAPTASTALGWNLLGAVVGGICEASSMWLGIKGLSLLAAGLYLLSWLAFAVAARQPGPTRSIVADHDTVESGL